MCARSAWSTMGVPESHGDPKKRKSLICFERLKHIFKRENTDFRGPLRKQGTTVICSLSTSYRTFLKERKLNEIRHTKHRD